MSSSFSFKYPIEYLDKSRVFTLAKNVRTDLEIDGSGESNLYSKIMSPNSEFMAKAMSEMSEKYTTDVTFLKQTQLVIQNAPKYKPADSIFLCNSTFCEDYSRIKEEWNSDNFKEKYSFIEWGKLDHLNHSSEFLQILSFINFSSPLLSLFIPVLFLIFPFILIRLKNVPITFWEYLDTLKEISRHHFIGKLLSIKTLNFENMVYMVGIAALFGLQTYQNVQSCIRFYQNTKQLNQNLCLMQNYIKGSLDSMRKFVELQHKKSKYSRFCKKTGEVIEVLAELDNHLNQITEFSCSLGKFSKIGYMLKTYYQIYSSPAYRDCLEYATRFNGFVDSLYEIHKKVKQGYLGKTEYSKNGKLRMKTAYYIGHMHGMRRHNDCILNKNRIITGVNASGKTTFLKMAAINIILSQQFGFGCFSSCKMLPYQHIHSYLNIPDTSGRDSLFQAESRRCKEIIDSVSKTSKTDRHFCIFDELYSGTNPEEATKSAISFLRFLSKRPNVTFLLTTHYYDVCSILGKEKTIENYKMNVEVGEDGDIKYTYITSEGISNMKGGIQILKTMEYPEEILNELLEK